MALFHTSPLHHFSKFNHFHWICWFLGKNLANFVYFNLKLHNLFFYNLHILICICICINALYLDMYSFIRKILHTLIPLFFATRLRIESIEKKRFHKEWKGVQSQGLFFKFSAEQQKTKDLKYVRSIFWIF